MRVLVPAPLSAPPLPAGRRPAGSPSIRRPRGERAHLNRARAPWAILGAGREQPPAPSPTALPP
eukprot:scaffold14079_cov39-Isochrysis_galbana.AAC.1